MLRVNWWLGGFVGFLIFSATVLGLSFVALAVNPPFEPSLRVQIAEARAVAKLGHQTSLNREVAKKLEYGDIVKFAGELYIVRHKDQYHVELGSHASFRLKFVTLSLEAAVQFTPDKFQMVWKCGTPEWQEVANKMVLGEMWLGVVEVESALTSTSPAVSLR
ncbi:MAG: hypothetical protein HZA94_02290 [Candidatus Vogelbacteria bacterium]|nr:hypothetical protein [Candidatus Vogelbacteria bacterium]